MNKKTNIFNFSQTGLEFPEYQNKLISYRDYKYFLPTNKELDIFNEIKELYDNSSLHASILNNLVHLVNGTGLIPATERDEKIIQAYNLDDVLYKSIFDFSVFGGTYLEIIWNTDHTKIVQVKHIKYPQIRIGNYEDDVFLNDKIQIYYHCSDWSKYKKKDIEPLVLFNPDPKSSAHQIYPILYTNFLDIYPKPYYYSGWRWLNIDIELSKFYLNLIKNNFISNTMINIPGVLDVEQKEDLEYVLKRNFTGSEGMKTIVFNSEDVDSKPEIIKFNNEDDGDKYHQWMEITSQQIVSLHNLPSTALAGIAQPGKLGSTEELKTAQMIYNYNKVYPFRNYFIDALNEINRYMLDPLSQIEIEDVGLDFQLVAQPTFEIQTEKKEK